MSTATIAMVVLLCLAVAVELLCGVALVVMENTYDRLHYLGPASLLGPLFVGAAVLIRHSSAQACIKIVLLALILWLIGPVLTHATARAIRIRQTGNVHARPDEVENPS